MAIAANATCDNPQRDLLLQEEKTECVPAFKKSNAPYFNGQAGEKCDSQPLLHSLRLARENTSFLLALEHKSRVPVPAGQCSSSGPQIFVSETLLVEPK